MYVVMCRDARMCVLHTECLFFCLHKRPVDSLRTSLKSRSAMLARGVAFASPVIASALMFSGAGLVDHRCMCSEKSF